MEGRRAADDAAAEAVPSRLELGHVPSAWLVTAAAVLVAGGLVGTWYAGSRIWAAGGAVAGLALVWLLPLVLGGHRRRRIRSALRSTRRSGTVACVQWHRRRGVELPYLMVADVRDGPVRWCLPLLRRPHLPVGVGPVRVHGGLRPGSWSVAFYGDRPLWPVGPVRHRPQWASARVHGRLPDVVPAVPRPVDEGSGLSELTWSPVRLSLKHTGGRVAVVAYELHTGRVLDSGFLPAGVGEGRALEQNGLLARCPQRNTFLYGPGWSAVAVLLRQSGAMAIPVRPPGLAG